MLKVLIKLYLLGSFCFLLVPSKKSSKHISKTEYIVSSIFTKLLAQAAEIAQQPERALCEGYTAIFPFVQSLTWFRFGCESVIPNLKPLCTECSKASVQQSTISQELQRISQNAETCILELLILQFKAQNSPLDAAKIEAAKEAADLFNHVRRRLLPSFLVKIQTHRGVAPQVAAFLFQLLALIFRAAGRDYSKLPVARAF